MISFIVPAYNEQRVLGDALDAMHAAGRAVGEPYEIVVADDASTDDTAAVAARHGAVVVKTSNRQIAATRNAGARGARGDCFIFVDADTLVNEAVVRAAVEALRAGAVGGGSAVAFDGVIPLYARLLMPVLVWSFRNLGFASGCFIYCTRTAFESAGGFDETFFGAEELVLSRALKRCGRFVVLRESVTSSGRKLRTHSTREVVGGMIRLSLRGPSAIRGRKGMELWYGERRDDPPGDAPH
jgi:glycosyltransferase involved in cell wall biosynthesis